MKHRETNDRRGLTRMQVPISQGYCNSFGEKAGACMLVKYVEFGGIRRGLS